MVFLGGVVRNAPEQGLAQWMLLLVFPVIHHQRVGDTNNKPTLGPLLIQKGGRSQVTSQARHPVRDVPTEDGQSSLPPPAFPGDAPEK